MPLMGPGTGPISKYIEIAKKCIEEGKDNYNELAFPKGKDGILY